VARRARPTSAGWLVPRALGPLAAVPVAAIAATVCAVAVLAPTAEEAAPDLVTRRPLPSRAPGPELAAPRVALAPAPARRARLAPPPRATERAAPDRAAILAAATSSDDDARAKAIAALRALAPDPVALDTLARLVEDPAPFVSAEAAMTLASLPDGRRFVVGRLRGGDLPGLVHVACIEALRDHGAPDDVPTLERFAAAEGPVGEAAAAAVRAICDRAGIDSPLPEPAPLGEERPARD
jgi:hypothetical protein